MSQRLIWIPRIQIKILINIQYKSEIFQNMAQVWLHRLSLLTCRWLNLDHSCFAAPLSVGRTLLNYRANDAFLLSFKGSEEVKILSKGFNPDNQYWGVEVSICHFQCCIICFENPLQCAIHMYYNWALMIQHVLAYY